MNTSQPTEGIAQSNPRSKKQTATQKTSKKSASKSIDLPTPLKKQKKPKLVRDSFTIPADEYQILSVVKKQLTSEGLEVRKTEIVRIGLQLVSKLKTVSLKRRLNSLQKLKVGRPNKSV